ncbi:hypothetical protein ABB37_09020 [Leptomonas pyrrhocoris]|uniref:Uncharacterized protein n=1 Tax=Leptomonas pyrrhocoris TaxID=157538 RepID=A0A0N0VD54_LEPPY|nr:hypothetical protein ABB37_09020 [Leptomonas pyrrhocoris]KPA74702.1 hypothetical protein ABB37_09020 [Leptomonas pyrrhocoris]|eukprot:XP_015653141.1 hypothetical protein ABB37_09020 [Leptomonas pyrrhocoris]
MHQTSSVFSEVPAPVAAAAAAAATNTSLYVTSTSVGTASVMVVLAIYVLGISTVLLAVLQRRRTMQLNKLQAAVTADLLEKERGADLGYAPHRAGNVSPPVFSLSRMGHHYQLDAGRAVRRSLEAFRTLSSLVQSRSDDDTASLASEADGDGNEDGERGSARDDVLRSSGATRRWSSGRARGSNGSSASDAAMQSQPAPRRSEKSGGGRRRSPRCGGAEAAAVACALRLVRPTPPPLDENRAETSRHHCRTESFLKPQHHRHRHHHRSLTSPLPSFGAAHITSSEEGGRGPQEREAAEAVFRTPLGDVFGQALHVCDSPLAPALHTTAASRTTLAASLSSSTSRASVTHTKTESERSSSDDDNDKKRKEVEAEERGAWDVALIDMGLAYEADNEAEHGDERKGAVMQRHHGTTLAPSASFAGSSPHSTATTETTMATDNPRLPSPPLEVVVVNESIDMRGPSTFVNSCEGETTTHVGTAQRQGSGLLSVSHYRCRGPSSPDQPCVGEDEKAVDNSPLCVPWVEMAAEDVSRSSISTNALLPSSPRRIPTASGVHANSLVHHENGEEEGDATEVKAIASPPPCKHHAAAVSVAAAKHPKEQSRNGDSSKSTDRNKTDEARATALLEWVLPLTRRSSPPQQATDSPTVLPTTATTAAAAVAILTDAFVLATDKSLTFTATTTTAMNTTSNSAEESAMSSLGATPLTASLSLELTTHELSPSTRSDEPEAEGEEANASSYNNSDGRHSKDGARGLSTPVHPCGVRID